MQNNKTIWYHIIALIVALTWGGTFINSKILILHGMSPAEIFVVRFLLAYICIWFISPKRLFCQNWKDELRMLLLGITGGSLYFVTENMAVGLTYVNNLGRLSRIQVGLATHRRLYSRANGGGHCHF